MVGMGRGRLQGPEAADPGPPFHLFIFHPSWRPGAHTCVHTHTPTDDAQQQLEPRGSACASVWPPLRAEVPRAGQEMLTESPGSSTRPHCAGKVGPGCRRSKPWDGAGFGGHPGSRAQSQVQLEARVLRSLHVCCTRTGSQVRQRGPGPWARCTWGPPGVFQGGGASAVHAHVGGVAAGTHLSSCKRVSKCTFGNEKRGRFGSW